MSEQAEAVVVGQGHNVGIPKTLTREDYCSPEIYERELTAVFERQWLLVGHVSLLKKRGDFYEKRVGPESMIFVRDDQDRIRAYFNVCRHRGYRLVSDGEKGCVNGFTCPYHRWTYDLAGKLRSVQGSTDGRDFDYSEFPLYEAQVDVWQGFIYVWMGKDKAPPLSDSLESITDLDAMAVIQPERMKMIRRETYIIDANWKVMLENDMECYHCAQGHPSLSVSCEFQAFFADKRNGQHFPLRDGMKTFSMDGERVCSKPLGTATDGFSTGFLILPFFNGPVFFVDHAVSLELTPLSVDRSQFICEWFVNEDAEEGVDYDVEAVTQVFHTTNVEDAAFGERNQRGIRSARFIPGPLNPRREDGIVMAYSAYRQLMAAE